MPTEYDHPHDAIVDAEHAAKEYGGSFGVYGTPHGYNVERFDANAKYIHVATAKTEQPESFTPFSGQSI